MKIAYHLVLAFTLRLLLVAYGEYHDRHMAVKYTDIDYHVFSDAAKHIVQGSSPYMRHTYRYTPLIAWLLTPNVWLHSVYGKILFSVLDVAVGFLIYVLVNIDRTSDSKWAQWAAAAWLYNPLPAVVCTRGNAESVVAVLVLSTVVLYLSKVYVLAGIMFGLAIHFKIYPIIYALSLYWALNPTASILKLFQPRGAQFRLVLGTVSTFVTVSLVCYSYYGWDFVEESYLYHITRRDIRHNFSIYFYMLYLNSQMNSFILALLPFAMQSVLLLVFSYYYRTPVDIPFSLFCQTFVFVTFNKVCTSQYFLWYLSLLPVCLPKLKMTVLEGITLLLIWFFAQGSWLLPAYYLEFEGRNTYIYIWLESIAFFCANVGILARLIRRYKHSEKVVAGMPPGTKKKMQ